MKIVIDARMAQGRRVGLGVYVANLVRGLASVEGRHRMVLLTSASSDPLIVPEGVEVLPVAPSLEARFARDIWEQIHLPRLLGKIGADVYLGPTYTLPVMGGVPCPTVVTFFDASVLAMPECYTRVTRTRLKWLMKMASRSANAVICGSDHALQECVKFYGPSLQSKAKTIHIALPCEWADLPEPSNNEVEQARSIFAENHDYLLTIGTVQPRKNFVRLIESFALLQRPDLRLLICGQRGWKSDDIYDAPKRYGVQNQVRFLGSLPTPEVRALMKGARAFVYPSLYEGFGLPPLEAFAIGTPVVASAASSIPEATGDAALLFDPTSASDMAKAITRLLSDAALSADLIIRGRHRLSSFSWERCAREHLEVFASVCRC